MKGAGRAAILGMLLLGLALGVGPRQMPQIAATEAQVVQITAVAGYTLRWSPADITIKSGEVTFAVTNPSSLTAHFFAVLNADEKKVAETTPRPDEVS